MLSIGVRAREAQVSTEVNLVAGENEAAFRVFVAEAEPRLRRALTAAYGYERGREATAEALAYAWENWDKLRHMDNLPGYLYRVGQSRTRRKKTPVLFEQPAMHEPLFEPGLVTALAALPERQRVAVFLAHGAGWTHAEVADLMGVKVATVQKHVERGLAHLRRAIVSKER
jgi:DNA-directed RNA polymerase specialized sigma24 family protein